QVDIRNLSRDVDRRRQHLEALGRRRRNRSLRRRRLRRLRFRWRRLGLYELDVLLAVLLLIPQSRIQRDRDRESNQRRVQDDARNDTAWMLVPLGLGFEQRGEHARSRSAVKGSTPVRNASGTYRRQMRQ